MTLRSSVSSPEDRSNLLRPVFGCVIGGWVCIFLYATQFFSSVSAFVRAFSVCIAFSGACLLSGTFLGFVFSIPRFTLGRPPSAVTPKLAKGSVFGELDAEGESSGESDAKTAVDRHYIPNTNLEELSDGLLKIIFGAGITQLPALVEFVEMSVVPTVTASVGGQDSPEAVGFANIVMIYFFITGIFLGYLWTRTEISLGLYQVDQKIMSDISSIHEKVESHEVIIRRLTRLEQSLLKNERQDANDRAALNLVNDQLNSKIKEVPGEELAQAIKVTSTSGEDQIFRQIQEVRRTSKREGGDIQLQARIIPVFYGLIAKKSYHRYYGELGFALKDQQSPDWVKAEEILTQAIQIRKDWKNHNDWTTYYELNRAVCSIHRWSERASKKLKNRILDDLYVAIQGEVMTREVLQESINAPIKSWLEQQGVTYDDILTRAPTFDWQQTA